MPLIFHKFNPKLLFTKLNPLFNLTSFPVIVINGDNDMYVSDPVIDPINNGVIKLLLLSNKLVEFII